MKTILTILAADLLTVSFAAERSDHQARNAQDATA
jgi:hypothetical protein